MTENSEIRKLIVFQFAALFKPLAGISLHRSIIPHQPGGKKPSHTPLSPKRGTHKQTHAQQLNTFPFSSHLHTLLVTSSSFIKTAAVSKLDCHLQCSRLRLQSTQAGEKSERCAKHERLFEREFPAFDARTNEKTSEEMCCVQRVKG